MIDIAEIAHVDELNKRTSAMTSNFTCSTGVFDCNYAGIPVSELSSCADYNNEFKDMENDNWTVIVSGKTIVCATQTQVIISSS